MKNLKEKNYYLRKKNAYANKLKRSFDLYKSISGICKFTIFLILIKIITIQRSNNQSISLLANNANTISINDNSNINENSTINNSSINNNDVNKKYTNVFFINDLLLWKNQTSLEEDRIKEEIKGYNAFNLSFENPDDFIQRENPLISLIITLYNQEEFINRVYYSILRQDMKDIEIIFIDDASTDNSGKIIKDLMEKDKRIIYLKNQKNRRAFYSRNYGISKAKGEYILVIDPDDILLNNILSKSYEAAKKYDLDIVHFYIMMGFFHVPAVRKNLRYKGGIFRSNSQIKDFFYNGLSKNLVDKLTKREVYLKAINFMDKQFLDGDYHINDDYTLFFGVIHYAQSYGFLEQIGYFYIARPPGPNHYRVALNRTNDLFFSVCNVLKYFYYQSENNTFEKTSVAYKYFQTSFREFGSKIKDITKGFDFILNVFDIYLNSNFLNQQQKNYIDGFKTKIIARKNQLGLKN